MEKLIAIKPVIFMIKPFLIFLMSLLFKVYIKINL